MRLRKIAVTLVCFLAVFTLSTPSAASVDKPPGLFDLLEATGDIMLLITDDSGQIIYANDAASNFYGYNKEDLTLMNISDINSLPASEQEAEFSLAMSGEENKFLFTHTTSSGKNRWVEVYSHPYDTDQGRFLLSAVFDVTERESVARRNKILGACIGVISGFLLGVGLFYNRKLMQKNKKLKQVTAKLDYTNNLHNAFINADNRFIAIKDSSLKYILANSRALDWLTMDKAQAIGKTDHDLFNETAASQLEEADKAVIKAQTTKILNFEVDNTFLKVTKFPVVLPSSDIGIGTYAEDITESQLLKASRKREAMRNAILAETITFEHDSIKDQLQFALKKTVAMTESEYGYIFLYDENKEELTINTWSDQILADCDRDGQQVLEQTGIWGEVIRTRQPVVLNDFAAPHASKKGFPKGRIKLSRFMSAPIIINGKIVAGVGLGNKLEPYDDIDVYEVTVLMTGIWNVITRKERERDLAKTVESLNDSRSELKLILDSVAEAIFGIDNDGICTFCNKSGVRMLGYDSASRLKGRHLHEMIHHTDRNGQEISPEECRIMTALKEGSGTHVDTEVFWREDGTCFDVEYFTHPQQYKGEVIGAVVTFMDNTEQKQREAKVEYLNTHDSLTNLYNRRFFEKSIKEMDDKANLPLSVIYCDSNHLKLINDVFGHQTGDKMLIKTAAAISGACRSHDIVARVGGDEFAVILPGSDLAGTKQISRTIKNNIDNICIEGLVCSIAIGHATKTCQSEDIFTIIDNAEAMMYKDKAIAKELRDASMTKSILAELFTRSPRLEKHTKAVIKLSIQIGQTLGLKDSDISKLRLAAMFHDIGKIAIPNENVKTDASGNGPETKLVYQHPLIGYRLLSVFSHTSNIAEIVLAHHEHWDGTGYPKKIKGEQIPFLARILAVADHIAHLLNDQVPDFLDLSRGANDLRVDETAFDPKIISIIKKQ